MKYFITAMLLLASIISNAQTFGFNKLQVNDTIYQIQSLNDSLKILPLVPGFSGSFVIVTNVSKINFLTNGNDNVVDIVIVGDTLAAFTELLRFITKQNEELKLATSVLEMIPLEKLYAMSKGNQYADIKIKAYRQFIKKKK